MKVIWKLINVSFTLKGEFDKEALVMATQVNSNALESNGFSNQVSHDPIKTVLWLSLDGSILISYVYFWCDISKQLVNVF